MRISVLGAGSWGTTLAILLAENSHSVTLWSYVEKDAQTILRTRENPSYLPGITIPETIAVTSDLGEALPDREMLVVAIPSQFIRNSLKKFHDMGIRKRPAGECRKGCRKRHAHDNVGDVARHAPAPYS